LPLSQACLVRIWVRERFGLGFHFGGVVFGAQGLASKLTFAAALAHALITHASSSLFIWPSDLLVGR